VTRWKVVTLVCLGLLAVGGMCTPRDDKPQLGTEACRSAQIAEARHYRNRTDDPNVRDMFDEMDGVCR
jgi:hypothetical protein